ncbi:aldehyde dehydrogenase family protein [Metapseudomonas otitidis]|uniref:aldehyde dehydrogenase family protein n=1 Tax=Metapseudomonas otitidis TaxID=319939 RepID=UPI00366DE410
MGTGMLYIDGRWLAPAACRRFTSVDPATEAPIQTLVMAGLREVDQAVCAARRAFDSHWRFTSGRERGALLDGIADDLAVRAEALALLEVQDHGKPYPDALQDVADAAACFRYYAGLARALDERQGLALEIDDPRFECRVMHEPVGVAALFTPFTFPLLTAAWCVAPALAAGAACVIKPSSLTPLSTLELARSADMAGLPSGVLNVLLGYGAELGPALVQHPEVDKVTFAGSLANGTQVMASAAPDIKPVSLELGGKSSLIVFDDADIETAVEWALYGAFWNQGQTSSALSRLLVQEALFEPLLECLVARTQALRVGPGMEPGVQLGPLAGLRHLHRMISLIAQGQQDARLLCGGLRPSLLGRGYFIQPAVFAEPDVASPLWRHECLGPVLSVKRFRNEEEALALANDTIYGLAAAVVTGDPARADWMSQRLRAGVVWLNCAHTGFIQAPWGGNRLSGNGRQSGPWGLQNYLAPKQVTRFVGAQPWRWRQP